MTGRQCLLKHNSTVFRHTHVKKLPAELVIVQKNAYWEQCTIMHNNEQCKEWCCTIGVVLLACTVYPTRCKKAILLAQGTTPLLAPPQLSLYVTAGGCLLVMMPMRIEMIKMVMGASDEYHVSGNQF